MKTATFTPQQIENFRAYEQVRASGLFNMFAHQAIVASGLKGTDYFFVMENYDALQQAAEVTNEPT